MSEDGKPKNVKNRILFSEKCQFCKHFGKCMIPTEINDLVMDTRVNLETEIRNRGIEISGVRVEFIFNCGHFVQLIKDNGDAKKT